MKTLIKSFFFILLFSSMFVEKILASETIKIGLVVPLSGEYGEIGNSILKSTRLAVKQIDDNRIKIIPKDNKANQEQTLIVSKQLFDEGVKIIIGPVFNENIKKLDQLKELTFLSFTNKLLDNPENVISAGVNSISQLNSIMKFQDVFNLERSIFLIPFSDFKDEIEHAIKKTGIKLKDKFIYDLDPTLLTSQIEEITRYKQRKQNLQDEIKRVENSNLSNKEKIIMELEKKDTLGGINFDSVIIGAFDENLKSVTTSLLYTDVSSKRVSYVTLNQWFDQSLIKEDSLQPIYFPSVNRENYDEFFKRYFEVYNVTPNHLAFLSYDLTGMIYYLLFKNNFEIDKKIFYNKNKFKGKIGIFKIDKNIITHELNLYSVENGNFKKIF